MDDDYAASVRGQQAARRWGASRSPISAAPLRAVRCVCTSWLTAVPRGIVGAPIAGTKECCLAALASTERRTAPIDTLRALAGLARMPREESRPAAALCDALAALSPHKPERLPLHGPRAKSATETECSTRMPSPRSASASG